MKKLLIFVTLCSPLALQAMEPAVRHAAPAPTLAEIAAHFAANKLTRENVTKLFVGGQLSELQGAEAVRDLFNGPFGASALAYMNGIVATLNAGGTPTATQKEQGSALLWFFDGLEQWQAELLHHGKKGFENYDALRNIRALMELHDGRVLSEVLSV